MLTDVRIGAICFYVSDPAETTKFYGDVLGLGISNVRDDGTGNDWLQAKTSGGVELLFFNQAQRAGPSPVVVFDLKDTDIGVFVDALVEKGVMILAPVTEAPGGWSAEFVDPDGYTLSVYQAAELRARR